MKLGVFTTSSSAYAPQRFKEEGAKLGISVKIVRYSDINFLIRDKKIKVFVENKFLPEFDLVIFRSFKRGFFTQRDYLLDFYFKKGARILNFKSLKKWPRLEQDKLIQHLIFQKKHLPFVQSDVYGKAEVLKNKIINFPKVIKAAYGSHGDNVFKVESKKDLRKIITKYPPSSLLVQPYLPGGQDLRVIVLGGRAIGAMKRIAQRGQFLTNYSAGGEW